MLVLPNLNVQTAYVANPTGNLGTLIRRYRTRRLHSQTGEPLKQAELAAVLGISLRTMGTWERTGSVPLHRVDDLGEALGGTFQHLSGDQWAFIAKSDDPDQSETGVANAVIDFSDELAGLDDRQQQRAISAARLGLLREIDAMQGERRSS